MLTRNEKQLEYLKDNNITLDYFPMQEVRGLCCIYNKQKHICLNSNSVLSHTSEFWVIEHELAHLESKALYTLNSSTREIKKAERKANDKMILKYDLPLKVLDLLKRGFEKCEIVEHLEITYNVIDSCIDYLYRKGYIYNNEF
jgi:Zn-dependent peptidase ImmA (M78 family)